MWTIRRASALLCSALLLTSCIEKQNEEESLSSSRAAITTNGWSFNGMSFNGMSFNGISFNGISFNGISFNGISFNGISFNGVSFNGVSFNGVSFNGTKIESLALDGSQLKAILTGGKQSLSGKDLAGSVFTIEIKGPPAVTYTIKIEAVTQDPKFSDVWSYTVSYQLGKDQPFRNLCTNTHTGAAEGGVLLLGMGWDEATGVRIDSKDTLTVACADGVIAKCTTLGYRPWASASTCKREGKNNKSCSTVPLKDHHQACTRMLRADYCGDGKPWTLDGTLLDIFDYLEPPIQLREEAWTFESRWQPTGAMCLSKQRHPELGFTGVCKDSKGKERKLQKCNPYEDDKGLVVSTFNGTGATGVKDK